MVVGVTGGIGSGKTLFAQELGRLGAEVIDADKIAEQLVNEREDIKKALRNVFGSEIFDKSGELKRRELGQIVFSNSELLAALNQIIRSPLLKEIEKSVERFQKNKAEKIVVLDMAILYETGLESLCDTVVVVYAPLEKRVKWLLEKRGWTKEEVMDRMLAQMDVREKIEMADVVIENFESREELVEKARDFYRKLQLISKS